jgi:carotenoid cleavage dioxygenase-like enzyme
VSSLGFVSLNDVLDYPFTAHPKQVGDTLHFIGYGAQPGHAAMKYGAYSLARAAVTEYFDVPLSVIPFAHDFAATPHYVVLFESSIQFSTDGIMEGDFFQLKDKHSFRVGVLPVNNASAASIQWFNSSLALGVIHVLNAWEAGDEVVVAASLGDTFDGTLQEEEGSSAFVMTVLRMNRATGAMSMTAIDKSLLTEFPRVHPAYTGTFARYGYAGIQSAHSGNFIGIAKFDLETQTVDSTLLYDDGMVAGEVIPVPKLGAAGLASDGVYLATFIHNSRLNQSEWHLYDGEVMQREPVARLLIEGRRVPFGFHCEWISEDRLQRHLLHATAPHKHSS